MQRSEVYRRAPETTAERLLAGLEILEPAVLKVQNLSAIAEISERIGKMADLLHDRATEPQDCITREKLDALFEGMEREAADRLARIGSNKIH